MDKKEILKRLQENLNDSNLKLPRTINFAERDGAVTITLNKKAIGFDENPYNMQSDAAAFEGWALALYVHLLHEKGTITLHAPVPAYRKFDEKYGHFYRFLYRVLRFSEQFPWFRPAPELREVVTEFRKELESASFVNNFPKGEAGESGTLENAVEAQMSKQNDLLQKLASAVGQPIGENPIYRQLPVGLFRETVADKNRVFSGGKSAIDLWTCDGNRISVFELKAHNKMIGMVTELFFYANYVYDMFCIGGLPGFCPSKGRGEYRGYGALLPHGDKIHQRVQAFFLYDGNQIHPLISEEVVTVLNRGSEQIQYARLSYELEITLK